jgi:iron(III) transport system permease protein
MVANVVSSGKPSDLAMRWRLPPAVGQYALWVGAMITIVGPLIPVVIASLWSEPLYQSGGWLTLDNFARLFADPRWWYAVNRSLIFSVMTTAGAVLVGTTMAVVLTRTNVPGRRIFATLLLLPITLPGLVLVLGWNAVWAPFGFCSAWLATYTPFTVPFDLHSLLGMSIVATTITAPIVYFFVRGALAGMDSSLEEAARSAGARPGRALLTVTIPMLRPAVLNSALLVFALSLEILGLALILGSPAGVEVIGTYLYDNWVERVPADQGLVSAGAVCLLGVVTVLLVLRNKLTGDVDRFVVAAGKPKATLQTDLGRGRWVICAVLAVGFGCVMIAPLIGVILSAFTTTLSPFINPASVLTIRHFELIFTNGLYVKSIVNSLLIAVIGALLTTAVVAVLSVVAHRSTFRFRRSLQHGMLWPRAVPGLVTGMAFFWSFAILDHSGSLRSSLWAMGLAFAVRALALAYSAFYSALAAIGEDMERAARMSGAGWWRAMYDIVLRMVRPAMVVSFVLLFASMLIEYDPAVFLVTPETPVMGLTMLQLSLTGVSGPVAALGVVQMALTFLVLGIGRAVFGGRKHG